MPTLTTNYSLNKPLVGDAIDEDLWGGYLNDNFDTLDTTVKSVSNSTYSNVSAKTANYTVIAGDRNDTINVDATSGNLTISLTAAATLADGFEVTIKKTDSSANTVTVDPNGTETIDGATTYVLSNQNDFVTIVCNGSNWFVKSKITPPLNIGITKYYESSAQSFTEATPTVVNHGLGAVPKLFQAYLECQTAEGGYSIGDRLDIQSIYNQGVLSSGFWQLGIGLTASSTQLSFVYYSATSTLDNVLPRKDTGQPFSITISNWKVIFIAWA